jgi:uncharacterized membrane protein
MEEDQTNNIKIISDYLEVIDQKIEKKLAEIRILKEKKQPFKTCLDILKNNIQKKTKHKKHKKSKKSTKTNNGCKNYMNKTLATKKDVNDNVQIKEDNGINNESLNR